MQLADITAGTPVMVRDAYDEWHRAVADSSREGTHEDVDGGGYRKVHDFPVVWVIIDGHEDRVPWPVEDVRLTRP